MKDTENAYVIDIEITLETSNKHDTSQWESNSFL